MREPPRRIVGGIRIIATSWASLTCPFPMTSPIRAPDPLRLGRVADGIATSTVR